MNGMMPRPRRVARLRRDRDVKDRDYNPALNLESQNLTRWLIRPDHRSVSPYLQGVGSQVQRFYTLYLYSDCSAKFYKYCICQVGWQQSESRSHHPYFIVVGLFIELNDGDGPLLGICHLHVHWATLTFDLAFRWAFRWAKVRSKYRLKSKSKVISLSERFRPNLRSKYILRPKLSWTLV